MKKVFALLISVVMAFASVNVVFAKQPAGIDEKPEVYVTVSNVNKNGKATIDVYFKIDTTFTGLRSELEYDPEEDDDVRKYYAKGLHNVQIEYFLNENYFDVSTLTYFSCYKDTGGQVVYDDDNRNGVQDTDEISFVQFLKNSTQDPNGWILDNEFLAIQVKANIIDQETLSALGDGSTNELKAAAKDVINSKTDLIKYKSVILCIAELNGAPTTGEGDWATDTYYAHDGKSDYIPVMKTGADAPAGSEPTAPYVQAPATTIENNAGLNNGRRWTVVADPDDLNDGKITVEIKNTNPDEGDATTTGAQPITVADDATAFGDGAVTFDVFMFIKNADCFDDTFTLTVNNGTATPDTK